MRVILFRDAIRLEEMTMAPKTVILDCDPGLDDALALLLALASPEEIDLVCVTTVGGNVELRGTTDNALRLLALAGRSDVPVHPGCARPLMRPLLTADHVHGADGIGGVTLPPAQATAQEKHAVLRIIEVCRQAHDGGVILCPTGPMTNIAMALTLAPDIAGKIERIVFMGGVIHGPGNVTPSAEYNIHVDPHAAQIVLGSGVPSVMMGLDVTRRIVATPPRIETLRARGGPILAAVADMLEFYWRRTHRVERNTGAALHDPCTIAWVIDPGLFEGRDCAVEIDCAPGINLGRSVADWWGTTGAEPNTFVVTDGDADRFFHLLGDRLARLGG